MGEKEMLSKVAGEWLAARSIIASALMEWHMADPPGLADEYAAAIIARLANHKPPILLSVGEE